MTKKNLQERFELWKRVEATRKDWHILTAYGKPSKDKIDAYYSICKRAEEQNGTIPRVLTHNLYQFTTGYCYEKDGQTIFVYDTSCNTYELAV